MTKGVSEGGLPYPCDFQYAFLATTFFSVFYGAAVMTIVAVAPAVEAVIRVATRRKVFGGWGR